MAEPAYEPTPGRDILLAEEEVFHSTQAHGGFRRALNDN